VAGRRRGPVEPWYGAYALLGLAAAGIVPVALPVLVVARSEGTTGAGVVIAALTAGQLSASLWGRLADRGRLHRSALIGGLAVGAVALAGLAVAPTTALAALAAVVLGVALAAPATAASLLVVERHPPGAWDGRLGAVHAAYGAGQVAGLAVAAALGGTPQTALVVAAAAVLAGAVVGLGAPRRVGARAAVGGRRRRAWLPAPPRSEGEWARADPGRHMPHLRRSRARPRSSARAAERRHLASWGLAFAGGGGFFALYPVLLRAAFGLSTTAAATAFAAAAAVAVVAEGPVARFLGRSGPLRAVGALRAALALKALALGGLAVAAAVGGVPSALVLVLSGVVVVAWALQGGAAAVVVAAIGDAGGRGPGTANVVAALGGVAGALGAGVLGDTAGPVGVLAAAAAALALAALLAGGSLPEPGGRRVR